MLWIFRHPGMSLNALGFIPHFLNERNSKSAREQIDDNYRHGGGWRSFKGFTMLPNGNLSYPGDPVVQMLAETKLRDEVIRFYEHSWIAIVQSDGSYDIARID